MRKDTKDIPKNLNLIGINRDRFIYVVSLLFTKSIFDNRYAKNDFIPLSAVYIKKIIGYKYQIILKELINMGIIESDNQYEVGKKSIGYRLTDEYRNSNFKQVRFSKKFSEMLEKKEKLRIKKVFKDVDTKYLYQCLHSIKLTDDAERFISNSDADVEAVNSWRISANMIRAKNFFFVQDKSGRLHTNITNLKSELRQFLRFRDKPLYEVDISNSQPLFLNILIDSYYNYRSIRLHSGKLERDNKKNPYDSNLETTKRIKSTKTFRKQTENGTFYQDLFENHKSFLCDNKLETNFILAKSEYKRKFFKNIMYSENHHYSDDKLKFAEIYPEVAKVIEYHKKDDYTQLAIKLQMVEAKFILKEVVPELRKKGVYCLSIHDAILTPEPELVKSIMESKFNQIYGLGITVKIK